MDIFLAATSSAGARNRASDIGAEGGGESALTPAADKLEAAVQSLVNAMLCVTDVNLLSDDYAGPLRPVLNVMSDSLK